MLKTSIEYRIPYGDVDQMGVVYYANYFYYFEILRNELIRLTGKSYKQIEEEFHIMFPVIEAYCNYKNPAKYDDLILIEGGLVEIIANRFRIDYSIYNKLNQKLLTSGYTIHFCMSIEGKPRKLPEFFIKALQKRN